MSSEKDIYQDRDDTIGQKQQMKEMDAFSLKLDFLTERWGKREDTQVNVIGKTLFTGRSQKTNKSENIQIIEERISKGAAIPNMETFSESSSSSSPEEFGAYKSYDSV